MTGPRANDCAEVNGPHPKHIPVCQRAGYANGLKDGAEDSTQRVRQLHRETSMSGVAWDCAEGDCEHAQCHDGGESPEVEFRVCAHELDLADQAGLLEEWIPGWVMYPCQTIKALDFPPLAATEAKPGAGEGA